MGHNDQTEMDEERTHAERAIAAALVGEIRAGDADAFGRLYDAWFDRVYDLVQRIVRDDATAADVAQDAFVSAWTNLDRLDHPESFGGWLLRIARNAALDRRRRDARAVAVDTEAMAVIEAGGPSPASAPEGFRVEDRLATADDPARAAEDGEIAALVWEAAEALGERDAEVLDLQLRQGLTPAEIGEVVGVSRNAANQLVHRLRARLASAVRARVLWRGGQPACAQLEAALDAAAVTSFDAAAVRVADEHAATCVSCDDRRATRLDPARLFAAIPIAVAPALLKQRVAAAMDAQGVPMGGSQHAPGATGAAPGRRAAPRARRLVVAASVVIVVATGAVALFASDLDDGSGALAKTTTSRPAPATTTTVVPVVPESPPESSAPPAVATPTAPPSEEEQPVPQLLVSFGLTPAAAPEQYSVAGASAPVLTWSVTGADAVSVTGPGLASTEASGSQRLCPGSLVGGRCTAAPGTYTYTLQASAGGGALQDQRSVTLTITP